MNKNFLAVVPAIVEAYCADFGVECDLELERSYWEPLLAATTTMEQSITAADLWRLVGSVLGNTDAALESRYSELVVIIDAMLAISPDQEMC